MTELFSFSFRDGARRFYVDLHEVLLCDDVSKMAEGGGIDDVGW